MVSRFHFRSTGELLLAFFRFRLLYRAMPSVPGFVRGSVAIADLATLFNLSVWRSEDEMRRWSGCDEHVAAVRSVYRSVDQAWTTIATLGNLSSTANVWAA